MIRRAVSYPLAVAVATYDAAPAAWDEWRRTFRRSFWAVVDWNR